MNIVFSFDDGRIDSYNASRILAKYGLSGSFHITTGFIDGTYSTNDFGVGRLPLTIEMLNEMISMGMEISSHGDRHIMHKNDFLNSLAKLDSMLKRNSERTGFSVPNSKFNELSLKQFGQSVEDRLLYIRVGRSAKCYTLLNKLRYFFYHKFYMYSLFKSFNKNNVLDEIDIFKIYSLVVKSDTRIEHLIKFIDDYKNSDSTLVLMFHSITEKPKDVWEYRQSDFIKLCEYVSSETKIKNLKLEDIAHCEQNKV